MAVHWQIPNVNPTVIHEFPVANLHIQYRSKISEPKNASQTSQTSLRFILTHLTKTQTKANVLSMLINLRKHSHTVRGLPMHSTKVFTQKKKSTFCCVFMKVRPTENEKVVLDFLTSYRHVDCIYSINLSETIFVLKFYTQTSVVTVGLV